MARPVGSTTKPQIRDFVTPDEIIEFVEITKKLIKAGNTDLLKWMLDQLYGKARQNIGLDGGTDEAPMRLLNYIEKNAIRNNNGDKENTADDQENTGDTGRDISE